MSTEKAFEIRTNETRRDLTAGTKDLLLGFQTRFPHLSRVDAEILAGTVMTEVGKRIANGDDIAFIRKNSDGTAELTILGLKPLE